MPKVFTALSGGVDSSVAAALLKERGFDVCGIHIKMWSEPGIPCTAKEDRHDAMRVAAKLDIPFQTWDFTGEYRKAVVEYMIREYAAGRTPNPDVMCNRRIKFGLFLKKALEQGADYVATGHYIRKPEILNPKSETNSKFKIQNSKLITAKDANKDQSYFLWTLTQEQLRRCLFPIGDYTKIEVREMARKFGLPTAEKPDSQGVCFIGEFDMRKFLGRHIPERKGRVLTTAGKEVGEHNGIEFYTIGQRQGIGIGGGIPYYVAGKNPATNTLTVAEGPYDEKLFRRELTATDISWISGSPPSGGSPLRCNARIRYRQPLQQCAVRNSQGGEDDKSAFGLDKSATISPSAAIHRARRFINLIVTFDEPQRAVTPGQSIVFYRGEEMLGGGIIA